MVTETKVVYDQKEMNRLAHYFTKEMYDLERNTTQMTRLYALKELAQDVLGVSLPFIHVLRERGLLKTTRSNGTNGKYLVSYKQLVEYKVFLALTAEGVPKEDALTHAHNASIGKEI